MRHARLLGDHAADVLHEERGIFVIVGEAVARFELVAVAHAKGHLSLLLGQSLVGEHGLVDLLLEGLLLERLEAGLQRLKALLDDLLLLVCQLVIVVVARAGEERVGDGHVGGGDVLVRGSRDGGHHHVSHDCSPGLGRRRGRVRYRSRETGWFLCAMRANDGEVPCVSFSQRASWSGDGALAQIVVVFQIFQKTRGPPEFRMTSSQKRWWGAMSPTTQERRSKFERGSTAERHDFLGELESELDASPPRGRGTPLDAPRTSRALESNVTGRPRTNRAAANRPRGAQSRSTRPRRDPPRGCT